MHLFFCSHKKTNFSHIKLNFVTSLTKIVCWWQLEAWYFHFLFFVHIIFNRIHFFVYNHRKQNSKKKLTIEMPFSALLADNKMMCLIVEYVHRHSTRACKNTFIHTRKKRLQCIRFRPFISVCCGCCGWNLHAVLSVFFNFCFVNPILYTFSRILKRNAILSKLFKIKYFQQSEKVLQQPTMQYYKRAKKKDWNLNPKKYIKRDFKHKSLCISPRLSPLYFLCNLWYFVALMPNVV